MILQYINSFNELLINTVITDYNGNKLNHSSAFESIKLKISEVKRNSGTVYLVGNGGSSAIVSHSAIDFLNACKIKAHPLTDNSQITCMANDYGYENVFSKALEVLICQNDVLIAVSSSGKSQNILNAVQAAKTKGAMIIGFSGFKQDNPLRNSAHYNFWLNSNNYGEVEIGHALLLHVLTDSLINI